MLSACLDRELKPLNPCLNSGVTETVSVQNIDKVDLLFLIDNSTSMEDKQKNLREHVPQLVQTLVTGKRSANDPHPFPPIKDLHIAVVDSDMGLVGINGIPGCMNFGDDGNFQHTPHPSAESPTCDASYPTFLSYVASAEGSASADKLEQDFGCIANVGAMGCGFEQQLEATLKSLWPARYVDPMTGQIAAQNPFTFVTDAADPAEALGHGDASNAGFQRNGDDPSLLAIIVLSDEDDGSTGDMSLYALGAQAPSWLVPETVDNINLRPLLGGNVDHLYPISRYANAFKALRPNNPQLVVYAAITGVPLELVDDTATTGVTFSDPTQRDAYYDHILNDSRMQATVDPATLAPKEKVRAACQTDFGRATPGRRYIELAKAMGENATVYSICQDDYTPAMDRVIDIIAAQLTTVCLPKPLVRDDTGVVKCDVVWQLPAATAAHGTQTPVACSERPYLSAPSNGHDLVSKDGGVYCTVNQLAVTGGNQVATGDGWYYDDFSDETKQRCVASTQQRVTFSANAKPPNGVTVKLECLNETQYVVDTRPNVVHTATTPSIGTSCAVVRTAADGGASDTAGMADALCAVPLTDGTTDRAMFCHPKTNTCVRGCVSDTECPSAWVCDKRLTTLADTVSSSHPQGSAYCVNPTCGEQ